MKKLCELLNNIQETLLIHIVTIFRILGSNFSPNLTDPDGPAGWL